MRQIGLILISLVLIVGFQNCGKNSSIQSSRDMNTNSNQKLSRANASSSEFTLGNPIAQINNSNIKGNIYFDGKNLTGMVCSDYSPSQTEIKYVKSGNEKTINPGRVSDLFLDSL